MPAPKRLKVGDRIRLTELPAEWHDDQFDVRRDSLAFMQVMIARRGSSRVCEIDENGTPWIEARIRTKAGIAYHWWAIMERSGWCRVQRIGGT